MDMPRPPQLGDNTKEWIYFLGAVGTVVFVVDMVRSPVSRAVHDIIPAATPHTVRSTVAPATPTRRTTTPRGTAHSRRTTRTTTTPTYTYTVQSGDTLSQIATCTGTTTAILASMNHLSNWNFIRVGHTLKTPNPYICQATPTSTTPGLVIESAGIGGS